MIFFPLNLLSKSGFCIIEFNQIHYKTKNKNENGKINCRNQNVSLSLLDISLLVTATTTIKRKSISFLRTPFLYFNGFKFTPVSCSCSVHYIFHCTLHFMFIGHADLSKRIFNFQ